MFLITYLQVTTSHKFLRQVFKLYSFRFIAVLNVLSLERNLLNKSSCKYKERFIEKNSHLHLLKRVSFYSLCICSFHHCDTFQVSSTHSCYLQNSYKAKKTKQGNQNTCRLHSKSHMQLLLKIHEPYLKDRWMLQLTMYFHLVLNPLYHSHFVHGFFVYLKIDHNVFQVVQH